MNVDEVKMKANEFVKKFGWGVAKVKTMSVNKDNPFQKELKRLVDSYESIKKDFESVEMAEYEYMVSASYNEPYWVRVKQAILDVESCK